MAELEEQIVEIAHSARPMDDAADGVVEAFQGAGGNPILAVV